MTIRTTRIRIRTGTCIGMASLLAALLIAGAARAQPAVPDAPPGFVVPADASYEAVTLDAEIAAIAMRVTRVAQIFDAGGLDDLRLLGEEHPDRLRQRFAHELAVRARPADPAAWQALYRSLAESGRHDAALGAAWRLHELADAPAERAASLLRLADEYAAVGRTRVARHVGALAVRAHRTDAVVAAFRALDARLRLRIESLAVEAEQSLPKVCLTLSRPLAQAQPIPLEDLVSIAPSLDALISSRGERLCIAGVRHGVEYTVTLHAGLIGADGEALGRALERIVAIPHRAPSVAFSPGAYVLPRVEQALLPVRSVNLDAVPLELFRVDDRNLVNTVLANLVRNPLTRWDRSRLANRLGARLWSGTLEVVSEADREVVTNLPVEDLIGDHGPGVYALTAPLEGSHANAATQWLVVSDLGLTTFASRDGLHVFVRSLADTRSRAGVDLTLVATNNRVLGSARTDADGRATFAPGLLAGHGGDAPALLTVAAGPDYNFLLLTGPALDLSERGTGGRATPAAADAFLFSERGIYRPGESVRLSILLRDEQAVAMPTLPLTVRLSRPGGMIVSERVVTTDALGAAHLDLTLSDAALPGTWRAATWLDPEGPAIGSMRFQVEDFVPPRIEVRAALPRPSLEPGESVEIGVDAAFYYGAPAAGLRADGRVRIDVDPEPFPEHRGFRFGREDQTFAPIALPLAARATDRNGHAGLALTIPDIADRSQPLRARITAAVHDVGGRPVYETLDAPLALHPRYVGLRSIAGTSIADGEPARFEAVALTFDGDPAPGAPIRYTWVREHYDYVWYVSAGRWSWRASVTDEPMASGETRVDAGGRANLEQPLPSGRYRLDVHDAEGAATASVRFHVGWWRGARPANVPDALDITLGEVVDETASAFIDAPFAGRALVTLGNERLQRHFEVDLPEDGREITFDIDPRWSPGLYLMVTAFRPHAGRPSPLPTRAMGLAWVPIGVADRILPVIIDAPAEARPRAPVSVEVRVPGQAGERVGLVLAAVDEGVLALTDFPTPRPDAYYFDQRALVADLRDLYGDLVATLDAPIGALRSGGGGASDNLAGVNVKSSEVVALIRRDVEVGPDGRAVVRFDLPDFNGRLRLMAVVYGERRLGAGEATLTVRDPVIADLVLPRFLAPGDRAVARLDLRNPGTTAQDVEVSASARGALAVRFDPVSVTLQPGEARVLPVALDGVVPGVGRLDLSVELGSGVRIARVRRLTVRPGSANRTERSVLTLDPGAEHRVGAASLTGYHDGARATVTVTNRVPIDVDGLLADLVEYPYGCTEQTISRALPQLRVTDDSRAFNTVTAAVAKVLDRQRSDGRFGAWSVTGGGPEWLDAYAYDLLWRAQAAGFDVPPAALALAERALTALLERGRPGHAAAYAAYVLARSTRIKSAAVRRFALAHRETLPSRLAYAHVAAALAQIGDREEADAFFERALRKSRTLSLDDYGSDIRDAAAMLALLAESGGEHASAVAEALERALTSSTWFSTQEQAWLLMAADTVGDRVGPLRLVAGHDRLESEDGSITFDVGDPSSTPVLRNPGDEALRVVTRVRGAPLAGLPAHADGYDIRRSYLDADTGASIDPSDTRQGQRLLVVIEGQSLRRASGQAVLVVDLLPAGFEIENTVLAGTQASLPVFVGVLSAPRFVAARDDRYVAALELDHRESFRLAYMVRAVTVGAFVHPGVEIEDMYAPRFRAGTATGRLTVNPG